MTFDPDKQPQTVEDFNAYVAWCGAEFERLSQDDDDTYLTACQGAAKVLVVCAAQMHVLPDNPRQDELLRNIGNLNAMARKFERQTQMNVDDHLVCRATLDCWEAVGEQAFRLLVAARLASNVMLAIAIHPLADMFDLPATDMWVMLGAANGLLEDIPSDAGWEDFAVDYLPEVVDRMQWQKVNAILRSRGLPPAGRN